MRSLQEVVAERKRSVPLITLREISAESGVSEPTICRIETKEGYNPSYVTATLVCRAMRVLVRSRKRKRGGTPMVK